MGKNRSIFPWERFPASPEVSMAVEALVEGIEEAPVEYFVEALEVLKILFEESHVRAIKTLRHLHNY